MYHTQCMCRWVCGWLVGSFVVSTASLSLTALCRCLFIHLTKLALTDRFLALGCFQTCCHLLPSAQPPMHTEMFTVSVNRIANWKLCKRLSLSLSLSAVVYLYSNNLWLIYAPNFGWIPALLSLTLSEPVSIFWNDFYLHSPMLNLKRLTQPFFCFLKRGVKYSCVFRNVTSGSSLVACNHLHLLCNRFFRYSSDKGAFFEFRVDQRVCPSGEYNWLWDSISIENNHSWIPIKTIQWIVFTTFN